ncbi:MAG: hypothetical protein PHC34_02310 [Candidatus Gastranaerophilales bacterium]|nr:hypothetical protein [Candidatus Gastranaerophilales bacterium]
MYQVYIKTGLDRKKIGEFRDFDKAQEIIETELAKNEDIKYVMEETTGSVDIYGELIANVVDEN